MALNVEGVVDGSVGGDETLGLALGLEPLHFPLSPADREVGVFHPIIVSQSPRFVAIRATDDPHRRPVRRETIGHDLLRPDACVAQ